MSKEEKNIEQLTEQVKTIGKKTKDKIEELEQKLEEGSIDPQEVDNLKGQVNQLKEIVPKNEEGELIDLKEITQRMDEVEKNQKKKFPREKVKSIDSLIEKEVTKDKIEKAVKEQRPHDIDLDLKQVDMTDSNTITGEIPLAQRESGINRVRRRDPFVQDIVNTGTINSNLIEWVEQESRSGGAGQTAEGSTYSQKSTKYKVASEQVKKITEYVKISEELWEDVDFIRSEIRNEIMKDIALQKDDQLLTGDGSGQNLKGLESYATAFDNDGLQVDSEDANEWDVLLATLLQIKKNFFSPGAILMHPNDVFLMRTNVDTQNQYLDPTFAAAVGMNVDGVPIIENTNVTKGDFYVLDPTVSTVFNRNQITIRVYDQNQDDPINGFFTVTGMHRTVHRVKANDTGGIVNGTFDSAKLQLSAGS